MNIGVEGKKEEPFGEENAPKKLSPEELERYQQEGQAMIDSYRHFFMTFAKDISLTFKLSNAFFTDLETGEVNNDASWFAERGYTKNQILWAKLHELSHFRDLAEDPKGTEQNFDYIYESAKDTGAVLMKKWEMAYGATDPEFIKKIREEKPISKKNQKRMNRVEEAAYRIHHTFSNILDDIFVYKLVSRKAPRYEEDEPGGREVEGLYREKLFPETDYSNLPRHLQFAYALIRDEIVKGEEVQVSDDVKEALDNKITFRSKEYLPREIVSQFVFPKKGRDTKTKARYKAIGETIEPVFRELLKKDIDEWQPKKPVLANGEFNFGGVNPFQVAYDEFDSRSPDQMPESEVRNWQEKHEEEKRKAGDEDAKEDKTDIDDGNPGAQAKKSQEKIDLDWARKHNISPEAVKKYRKLEQKVAPYLDDLAKLWQKIVFGTSRGQERTTAGYFKTGSELDVGKVIEDWPQAEKGDIEKIEAMKRVVSKEKKVMHPELIRVRLLGDVSGSMDQDPERIHVLQQCFALIFSSLREFNTYLNLTRSQTKSKLRADSEAWVFGSGAWRIKNIRNQASMDDEMVEIIRAFDKLGGTRGETYDNIALSGISDSLTEEDRKKIAEEKIMEIVFEVTDGGSTDQVSARKAVDNLLAKKVIVRAFQIGDATPKEKMIFESVWNKNRPEPLGETVGSNVAKLIPAIAAALKKYLQGVKI